LFSTVVNIAALVKVREVGCSSRLRGKEQRSRDPCSDGLDEGLLLAEHAWNHAADAIVRSSRGLIDVPE
jgi:hypothetical protein